LGCFHPDFLLSSISARQLAEWMAYENIEPFGEIRDEIRHGQQMAMTANLNRDTKKRKEPFIAKEFMNFIEDPEEKEPAESPESIAHRIKTELFRM